MKRKRNYRKMGRKNKDEGVEDLMGDVLAEIYRVEVV